MRRLPPMGALEAFVVVARHGSLKLASEALNLSVSALSRRIQSLEAYVGHPLFQRLHHELRLTSDGEWLLENVEGSFSTLSEALSSLRETETRTLRIGMPPAFAASWMLPRFAAFQAACPSIELKLDTSQVLPTRLTSGLDSAVLLVEGVDSDFYARRLKPASIFAVCAPEFVARLESPRLPIAATQHTMLVHRELPILLDVWRSATGAPQPLRVEAFDSGPTLFEAAANGLGIALAIDVSVDSYLQSGRLTRPFDENVDSPYAYHFVCRRHALLERSMRRFHDWMFKELEN